MIKNATFTSVWDGGCEVTSNCKVDTETTEVKYRKADPFEYYD